MKKSKERQQEIKYLLSTKEYMSILELAEQLSVTGATIRSDIRDMESRNEISRNNGIVSLLRPLVLDLSIKEKIFINAEKKERIGSFAAGMVNNRDSILLTSGTTIEAMTRHIVSKGELYVTTASISVALSLAQKEGIDIYVLGGKLVRSSLSVRSLYSLKGLENVYASKLFLSCDGFDLGAGVITATQEEARLYNAMMEKAGQIILLADSSKLGKTGFGYICPIKDIDVLVTDDDLPEKTRASLEEIGVRVIIV